jgi:hypothetical protein
MNEFHESMQEYKKQLQKGKIQKAYLGLMEYFNSLRSHFQKNYPDHFVMGSVYFGYMDMTYFAIAPKPLRQRKLKIAIVFLHEIFRFEVWLVGNNRAIQKQYYKLFTDKKWDKYQITTPAPGVDAVLEQILIDNPDFSDSDALTRTIEKGTLDFTKNVTTYLSNIT